MKIAIFNDFFQNNICVDVIRKLGISQYIQHIIGTLPINISNKILMTQDFVFFFYFED